MTRKKKGDNPERRKLKLKKETIRDLEAKGSGKAVKGGALANSAGCPTLTYCGTQCMCTPTDYCHPCCVGTGVTGKVMP